MAEGNQLWFVIFEGFGTQDEYKQTSKLKDQLDKLGLTLANLLHLLKPEAKTDEYHTYTYSKSMSAAVLLLTDEAIAITCHLYCRRDDVVQIFIRYKHDPSPNTSKAPSHNNSFAERRRISGNARRTISDLFTRSQLSLTSDAKNVEDLGPIAELQSEEKVAIRLESGGKEVLSKQYLLGYIQAKIDEGTRLTEIIITALSSDYQEKQIRLTKDVWMISLIRGPWKESFIKIWDERGPIEFQRSLQLDALKQVPGFDHNSKVLVRDLKRYGRELEASTRIHSTAHQYFLGAPYFTEALVATILQLPIGRTDLAGELAKLYNRKVQDDEDDQVCAAHELGPLYETAFNLKYDDFKNQFRTVSSFPIAGLQNTVSIPAGKEKQEELDKGHEENEPFLLAK